MVAVVPSCENRSAAPCSRQWLREAVVARAFRLETSVGIVDVDGEVVECEPLQLEVHPGVLTVMT